MRLRRRGRLATRRWQGGFSTLNLHNYQKGMSRQCNMHHVTSLILYTCNMPCRHPDRCSTVRLPAATVWRRSDPRSSVGLLAVSYTKPSVGDVLHRWGCWLWIDMFHSQRHWPAGGCAPVSQVQCATGDVPQRTLSLPRCVYTHPTAMHVPHARYVLPP